MQRLEEGLRQAPWGAPSVSMNESDSYFSFVRRTRYLVDEYKPTAWAMILLSMSVLHNSKLSFSCSKLLNIFAKSVITVTIVCFGSLLLAELNS